jgi:BMFP domain-containing protein YqiC
MIQRRSDDDITQRMAYKTARKNEALSWRISLLECAPTGT